MFGYGKRLKDLEGRVEKLERLERCRKGYHDWELASGSRSGIAARDDWTEAKSCIHCGEYKELKGVEA